MNLEFNIKLGLQEDLNLPKITRTAVRAVVMQQDKILLIASERGDFKLPGGGVEKGEAFENALQREIREEAGYTTSNVGKKLGQVIESKIDDYDSNKVFEQISHYYMCDVTGEQIDQKLDVYESVLGFVPVWIDIESAIKLNDKYLKNHPTTKGWTKRENLILKRISELKD